MQDEKTQNYVCSYCGKEYDTAPARAQCELDCDKKERLAAEQARRRQLEEERTVRVQEIRDALNAYNALVAKFNQDYPTSSPFDELWATDFPFLSCVLRGRGI